MIRRKKLHIWEKHYPEGVKWDIEVVPRPVFYMLDKSTESYPDNLCLEFEGAKLSYKEVYALVNKVAQGMQESGVCKGTRVGLFLPNCPYFVICYYAIMKIGAIAVNYSPLCSISELTHQIKDSGTAFLVTIDNVMLYEKASNLLRTTPLEKVIVGSLEAMLPFPKNKLYKWIKKDQIASVHYGKVNIRLESFFELSGEYKEVSIDASRDIAVLQYTGGTTGVPKAAILTHANVYINAVQCATWFAGIEPGKEKVMAALPFFHVFAMTAVMNFSILNGFAIFLVPKFSVHNLVRDIQNKKPTILPGVPTLFAALNNFPKIKNYKLNSLKAAVAGGAQLPSEIKRIFEENTGCKLIEGYGLTECSPVVSANPLHGKNKDGSIGMPLPGTIIEIRETEGTKKLVKDGKIGEICIVGPQVMQGYWSNEKETKEILKAGRLHTGDLGYMDSEGYFFVVDRLKEIIITSGFNVYPREIEELLYRHTYIQEAAVIGVPDKYKGEKIKAFVKLRLGESMRAEDIQDYLRSKLAKYKIPEEVEFVNELPKTLIGKISKKELKSKK